MRCDVFMKIQIKICGLGPAMDSINLTEILKHLPAFFIPTHTVFKVQLTELLKENHQMNYG